jgi:hypothetical protein
MDVLANIRLPEYQARLVHLYYRSNGQDLVSNLQVVPPTRYDALWVTSEYRVARLNEILPPSERLRRAFSGLKHNGTGYFKTLSVDTGSGRAVMDFRGIESNNIAHLLMEVVPLWALASKYESRPPIVLLRNTRGEYLKLLEHLGIDVIVCGGSVAARMVSVLACRGLAAYEFPLFDVPAQSLVRIDPAMVEGRKANGCAAAVPRIVVGRRLSRRIANEAEVRAVTQSFGYQWVYMEDFSIAEKLAIGAAAEHVIAATGAGMAPLAFAKSLKSVVELTPAHTYGDYYAICLDVAHGEYYQLMSDFDARVVARGWKAVGVAKEQDIAVNVHQLAAVLEKIHAKAPPEAPRVPGPHGSQAATGREAANADARQASFARDTDG